LAGGNINTLTNSQVNLIDTYGNNGSIVLKTYLKSFASMLSSSKQNPTEAEKAVIKEITQKAFDDGNAVTTSQTGLENAFTDAKLKLNPENYEFYQMAEESTLTKNAIIADPAKCYQIFTKEEMTSKFAHYAFVLEDFKKRYRSSK
jgi:hypothetical protein